MVSKIVKAIQTPPQSLIQRLTTAGESITVDGVNLKNAVSLMEKEGKKEGGGFAQAVYLYQNEQGEYRVIKQLQPAQVEALGGVKRKKDTFNGMYQHIYGGKFAELATAKIAGDTESLLDMPYIHGENVEFSEGYNIIDDANQRKLFEQFEQSGYFITDYRIPGNVVQVTDSEEGRGYLLVRDVDLMGRRNSMEVTPKVLDQEFSEYERQFGERREEYEKLKAIHGGSGEKTIHILDELVPKKTGVEKEFAALQTALLERMVAKKITGPAWNEVEQAKNFPQLCNAACQHHNKVAFWNSEQTATMDALRDLLQEKGKYPQLKSDYDFDMKGLLNVQLRSIGATGKNIIGNTLAKGDNLKKARNFFRELYHVDFDGQHGHAMKQSVTPSTLFHEKEGMALLKAKLKGLKEGSKTESIVQIKPNL